MRSKFVTVAVLLPGLVMAILPMRAFADQSDSYQAESEFTDGVAPSTLTGDSFSAEDVSMTWRTEVGESDSFTTEETSTEEASSGTAETSGTNSGGTSESGGSGGGRRPAVLTLPEGEQEKEENAPIDSVPTTPVGSVTHPVIVPQHRRPIAHESAPEQTPEGTVRPSGEGETVRQSWTERADSWIGVPVFSRTSKTFTWMGHTVKISALGTVRYGVAPIIAAALAFIAGVVHMSGLFLQIAGTPKFAARRRRRS